ncbi:DUF3021 domain-containing protein [Streptococcus dentasini]
MMRMIKKGIVGALIGIGAGELISFLAVVLVGKGYAPAVPSFIQEFDTITQAVGVQLLIFAVLGCVQGMASFLFQSVRDKQGLLFITSLHYGLVVLPLLAAGWYLHWFSLTWLSFAGMFLSISLVYTLIFLINYLSVRRDIGRINAKLG